MPVLIDLPNADHFDFRPTFDWRVRLERRLDRGFAETVNDNRSDALNRIRPGLAWTFGKKWSGEIQYQLAHDEIWRPAKTASDEASDLNLLYVKHKDGPTEVTVGRQKINIGSERLIGALEWSMTGRSFDGIRLRHRQWEAYAFKVGVAYPKPGRTRIAGVSYAGRNGLSSLIFKHDDQATPAADVWTANHLWQRSLGKWTLDAEAALQTGHTGGRNLRAWAIHFGATHAFDRATKGFVEINAASGGGNANTSYTFDNLLPTNHKFYGSMDLQSWRNMEELSFGVDRQLSPKWNLRAHLHSFSLRDPADGWYGAGGGLNQGAGGGFMDPTGSSGRDVGRELDLEFTYKRDPRCTLAGGVGVFWPGGFVQARNGGAKTTQYWGFVGVQFRY